MRGPARRTGRPLPRLRRLLFGRNELRRPSDRIERAIVVSLAAAFLTALVAAAFFAGHFYQSQRALAARSRPAVAVPSRPGPTAGSQTTAAGASWRPPDRTGRSGTLTSATGPTVRAAARTSIRGWPDRSGEPPASPPSPSDMMVNAVLADTTIMVGAAVVLTLCYLLCRMALDRHRLARWESAWAVVGPQWTSRR
ncbi:MAG TPA: hypothetical protein VF933_06605 [Streptosporangiaceae bacterium]